MYSTHAKVTKFQIESGIAIAAALTGAGLMFLLDPRSGRRRRALLIDQVNRGFRDGRQFAKKVRVDAENRTRGLYHQSRSALRSKATDDETLVGRIRSALGRLSAHPGAIEVSCEDRVARLTGDILAQEVGQVLRGIRNVPGVRDVVNEMHVHEDSAFVPALQGRSDPRASVEPEYLQDNWSPAPRVLASAIGLGLLASSFSAPRAGAASIALGVTGAAILARAVSNRPLTGLISFDADAEEGFMIQKTLDVYAEVDDVYGAWRALENFPTFMSHIRAIERLDERRYRWVVDGPAGIPVTWESEITADVPNELIAWRTAQGSPVQSSGVVQFEPTNYGGTRVHVRMCYRPPANAIGHAAAAMFAKDPRHQIDDDLLRFKSFMETGKTTGSRGTVLRH